MSNIEELKGEETCLECSDCDHPNTCLAMHIPIKREYVLERIDALHMVKRYLECNHYDIWHDLEKEAGNSQ